MKSVDNFTCQHLGTLAIVRINGAGATHPDDIAHAALALRDRLNDDTSLRAAILVVKSADNQAPLRPNGAGALARPPTAPGLASIIAGVAVPTIAAIEDAALNETLELALACDLRVAADDTTLGFDCVARGEMPQDGGTQRLTRIVGQSLALEMLLTGKLLSAGEARDFGLINSVSPPGLAVDAAIGIGRSIERSAPLALRLTKEATLKGQDLALSQGMAMEADLALLLHTTNDRAAGLKAFAEKRKPTFTGE